MGIVIFVIAICFCWRRWKKIQGNQFCGHSVLLSMQMPAAWTELLDMLMESAERKSTEMQFSYREASLVASDRNMLGENLGKVNVEEVVLYKLEEMAAATSNFSNTNKLAQGGFGPVYRVIIFRVEDSNIALYLSH